MDSPWAHLPNAKLIDRLTADAKANRDAWDTAADAADEVLSHAHRVAAWDAAWRAASEVHSQATRDCVVVLELRSLWRTVLALIAWPEDSALMLDMPVDAVRLLAASGHHPAVLMLSACIALSTQSNG